MNPNKEVKKILGGFRFASQGIIHAFRADHSFRLEIILGAPVFILLAWIMRPMTAVETILLWGSYLLILSFELINTAIERLLERLHPEEHELIGASKDIAAAAVLMALIFAFLTAAILLWSRYSFLFFDQTIVPAFV
jgi:diacylglycerol kinase